MKTNVIILLSVIMSTMMLTGCIYDEPSAYAGEYPFVKEGKSWNCYHVFFEEDNPQRSTTHEGVITYKMMGDTTISIKKYKKLYLQSFIEYGDEQWHYLGAVRERGDHIYIIYAQENEEYLLYDFGVGLYDPQIGLDYFTTWYGEHLFFWKKTPYGNTGRQLYHYKVSSFMCTFYWLKGVGDLSDPFRPNRFTDHVLSCFEGDSCIYQRGEYGY